MIGQTISHFKILEKLGEGGMGVVYKAHDTKLDRMIALKFLPAHVSINEETKARFLQEAKAAAALNHPNICTIHGVEEDAGNMFIIMEFVDGGTLRQKIPYSGVDDVVDVSIQISEALQEAHAKGVVHRDIKADNIMLTSKGQAKIMDFGLAKLKGSLKLTRTSSAVGTLAYMAPEQIQGGEVDTRSDIFSFGALLFEMLTGKTPFRGEHEAAMLYSIVNEDPMPLEQLRQGISPLLSNLILRCLEKDPADRYQSVNEMAIELRRLRKQSTKVPRTMATPSIDRTTQSVRPAGEVVLPQQQIGSASPVVETSSKNRTIMGVSILVIVLLAFVLYQMVQKEQKGEQLQLQFQSMKITQLTSNGKTGDAAISPDGKYLVHVVREAGKRSLWVKQVSTGSTVQILPLAEVLFVGITISFDGEYIYYVVNDAGKNILYKVPILGGTPRKILEDVQSAVTLSPDGKQIAFYRYVRKTGDFSFVVANEDGTGERVLASHRGDLWFAGMPAWSPDGDIVAGFLGRWAGGMHYNLVAITIEDGKETPIGTFQWDEMGDNQGRVEWLRDGKGLICTGTEKRGSASQVWYCSYPSGDVQRITNDLNEYEHASLTADGKALSVVQVARRSNIWVLPEGDIGKAGQVTNGKDEGLWGISLAPDGKIIYTGSSGGNTDLWIMNPDGSDQRQLTSEPSMDVHPAVSNDNRYVVFSSYRSGIPNIWRINIDGSQPHQLTGGGEDYNPDISPDGKWVVFRSWDAGPLLIMKMSIDGGELTRLGNKSGTTSPSFSPDGKRVAYSYIDEQRGSILIVDIVDFPNGSLVTSMQLPSSAIVTNNSTFQWTPDGHEISFVEAREGVSNIWSQSLAGGPPKQITTFKSGIIYGHAWSRDGKMLVMSRGDITSDAVLISNFR